MGKNLESEKKENSRKGVSFYGYKEYLSWNDIRQIILDTMEENPGLDFRQMAARRFFEYNFKHHLFSGTGEKLARKYFAIFGIYGLDGAVKHNVNFELFFDDILGEMDVNICGSLFVSLTENSSSCFCRDLLPEDLCIMAELTETIQEVLSLLSEEERMVLEGRFGHEDLTLDNLALSLGCTRERVRQVEENALKKVIKLSSSIRRPGCRRLLDWRN